MDHRLRPIINPSQRLVNNSGYAECINGGKSRYNEDQAVCHQGVLQSGSIKIPYLYFALFDGHAGVGAAICAANQLHHVIHQRLVDAQDDIWSEFAKDTKSETRHNLIVGALEISFNVMDDIIKEELVRKQSNGGCTALVAISLLGFLYVANAGDSRAIVCSGTKVHNMSNDFTPETEKIRIRQLAQLKPQLLGNDYTYYEYIRPLNSNDLGKRILFKDSFMKGWTYKTVVLEDLKPSLITGQGKRSRVMATIGVTRGFGDHDLVSVHQRIPIKPFLTCHPEVQVYDLKDAKRHDVLVMGTDGLWDVIDGAIVAHTVNEAVQIFDEKEVYISAATCLVGAARGSSKDQQWMLKNGKAASVDDISVFVVPLYQISKNYKRMLKTISLRLPTALPDVVLDEYDEDTIQNGDLSPNEKGFRLNYLTSVVETIKEKQQRCRQEVKHSDLCFVITDRAGNDNNDNNFKIDNTLNVNVNGYLPKDDFLLINVQSIDSIDVLEGNSSNRDDLISHFESLKLEETLEDNSNRFINLKKVNLGNNGSVELLLVDNDFKEREFRLRSRSFPGVDTAGKRTHGLHASRDRARKQFTRYKLKLKPNYSNSPTRSNSKNNPTDT
ncbi:hypothetical protein Trydic_g21918 [Trypoxylus dichotomus]